LTVNAGTQTFFATAGQNAGDLAHPTTTGVSPYKFMGSTWNFDFYIKPGTAAYSYTLSYGIVGGTVYSFNPLADVDAAGYTAGTYQDSQNLLFPTFGGAANGFAALFDPNANETYEFTLTATGTGGVAAQSHIFVQVGTGSASVPDGGSTCMLLGMALTAGAALRRKLA
jgi:hypothetical protein